jgi:hypothetical protein
MAQIEAWLWTRLKTYSGITALSYMTQTGYGVKVRPLYAPTDMDVPFITFRRSSTDRDYNTNKQDGLPRVAFEINVWDDDYPRLMTVSEQVRLAIDGYRVTTGDYMVRRAFIEDESDISEPADWGFEQESYGRQFVLVVVHTETVPDYTA